MSLVNDSWPLSPLRSLYFFIDQLLGWSGWKTTAFREPLFITFAWKHLTDSLTLNLLVFCGGASDKAMNRTHRDPGLQEVCIFKSPKNRNPLIYQIQSPRDSLCNGNLRHRQGIVFLREGSWFPRAASEVPQKALEPRGPGSRLREWSGRGNNTMWAMKHISRCCLWAWEIKHQEDIDNIKYMSPNTYAYT